MKIVLPAEVAELHETIKLAERHPGLQLDKYSRGGKQEDQSDAIEIVTQCKQDNQLLSILNARRRKCLEKLETHRFTGTTQSPLTLHLSSSGALENAGIAMHPIYGFAWLPGTGLKGMTRAYAETVWKPVQENEDEAKKIICEAFGYSDSSEDNEKKDKSLKKTDSGIGRLVFHDAWPQKWPILDRDIVNNHHTEYYNSINSSTNFDQDLNSDPPGDWEDPVPISFLIVTANTEFDFAISDRNPQNDKLLETAIKWLYGALHQFGAGAKNAAGYGRFKFSKGEVERILPKNILRKTYNLELISPAFLAGAKQEKSDCEVRAATIRGLLRWWWRTIHAGKLSVNSLRKLEELVWGSTNSTSPISISIVSSPLNKDPQEYIKKNIKNENNLTKPKNMKKSIQGLYYISYGMDEVRGDNFRKQRRRQYREDGDQWSLIVTIKEANYNLFKKNISTDILLSQFEASLWLLTNFGGIGSKSRKGFGSFQEVELETISTIEDCLKIGEYIRLECDFESVLFEEPNSPSLEHKIGPLEVKTNFDNIWQTLNQVGDTYQDFIKSEPKVDRKALGTPRNLAIMDETNDYYMERHSSPVHWSISKDKEDKFVIRMLAFPSRNLPNFYDSVNILNRFSIFVEKELKNSKSAGINKSRKFKGQKPTNFEISMQRTIKDGLPKPKTKVKAVILEGRTRKGKLRVKELESSMIGTILNSDEVSSEKKHNDVIEVVVRASHPNNAIFQWVSNS